MIIGAAVMLAVVQLIFISIPKIEDKDRGYSQDSQSSGNNTDSDDNYIDLQIAKVEKVDVTEEYRELQKEFEKREEDYSKPTYNAIYKIGTVYDLDKSYIGKSGVIQDTSLDSLDFGDYDYIITPSEVQRKMQNIVQYFQIKRFDAQHEVSTGDMVTIKLDQTVEGVPVDYIHSGYIQYEAGTENSQLQGLDDVVIGHKPGYEAKFSIQAPENTFVNRLDTGESIDIQGKTVEFNAEISWVGYKTDAELSDDLIKQYVGLYGIQNINTVEEYENFLIRNYAWKNLLSYSNQYIVTKLSAMEPSNESYDNLSEELTKHLNLVASSVEPGYDYVGEVYDEYIRVQVAEFYNALYNNLPQEYKHDPNNEDDVNSLLADIYGTEFLAKQSGQQRQNYPNQEQFGDFIRKAQVLQYYIDKQNLSMSTLDSKQ